MRRKKDLPLAILKALEPYVNLRGEKFEVIEPKDHLLSVVDKDQDSQFYFNIEKYQKANNGAFQFYMSRSPKNANDINSVQAWVEVSSLGAQFESWLKLLEEYDAVNSFFDDPILNSFKSEFFSEFEIIDDDAEYNPFNTNQILFLDAYLNQLEERLIAFANNENQVAILEIQKDIGSLRENLTKTSKKWVVDKMTYIWAKIAKQGTSFLKEFLSESKKELIKQGVKGLLSYLKSDGLDFFT